MLPLVIFISFYFTYIELYKWIPKHGWDTSSYLQQAGHVWRGETNYKQITGNKGPCFYPAGHLWHYVPLYLLYEKTSDGFQMLKAVYITVYAGSMVVLSKICLDYFRRSPPKAQMVILILLSNENVRKQQFECILLHWEQSSGQK